MVRARPVAPSLWRSWVLATRVPTLTAAVTPVLVGTAAAARVGRFDPSTALAALAVALAIQIGTNFANDALDFLRGADHPARLGPPRVTQSGVLSSRQVLTGAYLCFGLAAFVGLRFAAIYSNPPVRVGKAVMRELVVDWISRLDAGGHAYLVVKRSLGSDSFAAWLAERGWAVTRLGSRRGYRVLDVAAG